MGCLDPATHDHLHGSALTALKARSSGRIEAIAVDGSMLTEKVEEYVEGVVHSASSFFGTHTDHREFLGVIATKAYSRNDAGSVYVREVEQLPGDNRWVAKRQDDHAGVQFPLDPETREVMHGGEAIVAASTPEAHVVGNTHMVDDAGVDLGDEVDQPRAFHPEMGGCEAKANPDSTVDRY